ncbi:MAG: maleylacetate reductase [Actinomycetota bacterium]|nr:maleylacetate reductase [Actinomycetota bacterium]
MTLRFEHQASAQRVLFGAGTAASNLAAEVERRGTSAPILVAGDRYLALIEAAGLGGAVRYGNAVEHVPIAVAEQARALAEDSRADLVVAIGGGSATGLAKAIALTTGLVIVAVPTTLAGSEATNVWGLTEDGHKRTGVDPVVVPATVIYDPDLLASLPSELAVASGLNAIAHCIDAMWAPRTDPIDQALAMEALSALRIGLPGMLAGEADASATTLYGCYLAGVAFSCAGSALHHKICHVLGGAFNLPHAPTHAIVLPHVLAFNAPYALQATQRIAAALGSDDAVAGLERLRQRLGAPRALRDLGLGEADLAAAVTSILPAVPPSNPRVVTPDSLAGLLHRAWSGDDPRMDD